MSTLLGTDQPLSDLYTYYLLDLDGVVYTGPQLVPGAGEALADLRGQGHTIRFVTNNASRSPSSVAQHLRELGAAAHAAEVATSATATAQVVATLGAAPPRALAVGAAGLVDALEEQGVPLVSSADDAPEVVVMGFGPDVGWRQLAEASIAVQRGARLVATNMDASVPQERGLVPANGALVTAVVLATGATPMVVGKPEPAMYEQAVAGADPARALAVGDRIDTDMRGAKAAGIRTMFVLTGSHGGRDLLTAPPSDRPDFLALDLGGVHDPHPAPWQSDGEWRCGSATARVTDGTLTLGGRGGLDALRAACAAVWAQSPATATPNPAALDISAIDGLQRQLTEH